jgi:hypothetical protein
MRFLQAQNELSTVACNSFVRQRNRGAQRGGYRDLSGNIRQRLDGKKLRAGFVGTWVPGQS